MIPAAASGRVRAMGLAGRVAGPDKGYPHNLTLDVHPMPHWRIPAGCDEPLMLNIGAILANREIRSPGSFPDLRVHRDLALACDYSGDHQGSAYQVLTFLLADGPGIVGAWDAQRLAIRKQHMRDGRRMAFKSLSDRSRQRALGPFLEASAGLNGIIFCVAVDKGLLSHNFGYQFPEQDFVKPRTLSKMILIGMLGSFLVGGLTMEGQTLFWITDEDEIVSNDRIKAVAGRVFGSMLYRFCPQGFEELSIGVSGKFDDDLRAEDLCSIPDLVGGAVAESLTSLGVAIPQASGIFTPLFARQATKTNLLLQWISSLDGPLRFLMCIIRPAGDGQLLVSFGEPALHVDRVPGLLWTPPDKGWNESLRSWRREFLLKINRPKGG